MKQESREFPVYARDGSRILAGISDDPAPNAVALARSVHGFPVAAAIRLKPPTGRYNCHGLVFASRRAHIPPVDVDLDVDDLLRRDGFGVLPKGEKPCVGDVVAYRIDGEIEHTGFVSRVESIGDTPVVFIWSAWGVLGEFEHRVQVSPYKGTPEYWRLKC